MPACMYVSCLHPLDAESHNPAADRVDDAVDEDDDFTKLFFPGAVVASRELIERRVTMEDLQHLHLQAVLMCVRGDAFEKLTVKLLREIDPNYDFLKILYGPWAHQLTPAVCSYMGLDADALIAFGIHKKNVRDLEWPLSRWVALFGVDHRFLSTLHIDALHEYFPDLHRDMRRLQVTSLGGDTVGGPKDQKDQKVTRTTKSVRSSKKSQPIFEIEL